ncbi:hypothetical protein OSH11_14780 [Kaistia dalseonensis]|uniref:Uncharacterized protein n=1 Tax=Kaistia dalseonensis TaxID=410840 RepID=A0ABU0H8E1_9HYPH|nr:hypothetical protein [Kaistia dalseonensis]MCX5495976.1 hypothetical protein [Kaistia dalseonensis]MDQ0438579.1 hypothetical protein [Kaistia dalseonensis]
MTNNNNKSAGQAFDVQNRRGRQDASYFIQVLASVSGRGAAFSLAGIAPQRRISLGGTA